MKLTVLAVALLLTTMAPTGAPHAQTAPAATLAPTNHPRVPADLSQLWLAPVGRVDGRDAATAEFLSGVNLEIDGDWGRALPIFQRPAMQQGALGDYAIYYAGLAQLRLGRAGDARDIFRSLQARKPVGYVIEAAAMREAEADEALGNQSAAADIYARLSHTKTTAPDDVLMHLGKAAKAAGDFDRAALAFGRVYYEFPFSDLSPAAATELQTMPNVQPIAPGNQRYKLELGRAERMYASRRFAPAREAFEALRRAAPADDRELLDLRIAECDYYMKRPRNARDGVRPYLEHASRQGEALFFYAIATRDLGDHAEYRRIIRRVADEFPDQSWAEEALNNLATFHIVQDEDDQADAVFREMYERFPTGHYAERAAWKIGWRAYNAGRYADATRIFERAAVDFPRSDYRPMWLYWSARAHSALQDALADARYRLVATDYLNSYYGRLAIKHLSAAPSQRLVVDEGVREQDLASADGPAVMIGPPPPNAALVRALLGLQLYDQALDELHYAQKVWGDSSPIQATIAWIYNRRGDLRAGINAMKRAYPQYLASGGEQLPAALLRVLFPVNYWPQIRRYATERGLDPYLIAALIEQESTFTADVRSVANAYGLMQIVPATGRQYARKLNLKSRFSIGMLTTADINLRMGTAYFADLVQQFGGIHYALATYNAGPHRVVRWIAERPGMEREQFIDDIPFPETQDYVKKIIGRAEDYRRLYGPGSGHVEADAAADATPAVATHKAPPAKTASAVKKAAPKKPSPTSKKKSAGRKTRKAA